TSPTNCLMGVTPAPTVYGYPLSGWNANITGLPPTARWMWAPNVTGASSPAQSQAFTFQKDDVYVCNPPQDATISIAADNSAEVSVNGMPPVSGSTSTDHSRFTTFTIPAASIYGSSVTPPMPRANTVTIKASNGLNPSNCASDQYSCNPAGVIFWASFKFAGDPKCSAWKSGGPTGGYGMGEKEKLSDCPSGQIGSISHTCVCGGWLPAENTCAS